MSPRELLEFQVVVCDVGMILVCGLIPPILVRGWADRDQKRAETGRKTTSGKHRA